MSLSNDTAIYLTTTIKKVLESGLVEEIAYQNLLKEAELGIIPTSDVKHHPIYTEVQAKRLKRTKNVK